MMITLDDTIRSSCINVSVLDDDLVEGREFFQLYFETFAELGSYSVNGSNSREVTIIDTDG